MITEATRRVVRIALKILRLKALEKRNLPQIQKAFRKQELRLLKALAKQPQMRRESAVRELEVPDWWSEVWHDVEVATDKDWQLAMDGMHAPAIVAGANDSMKALNLQYSFAVKDPRMQQYLEATAGKRITAINQTTRDAIHGIIVQGSADGLSYDEIAKKIGTRFTEMRVGQPQLHIQSRAHLIALTEVGDAYNEGTLIGGRDLQERGIPMMKRWGTVGDDRVSPGCRANAEQGYIRLEDVFQSGHMRPLRFPGCRCTLLTEMAPDEPGVELPIEPEEAVVETLRFIKQKEKQDAP